MRRYDDGSGINPGGGTDGSIVGAVVDAYTTGAFLPGAFARKGAKLVHVQSRIMPEGFPALELSEFVGNRIFDGEQPAIAWLESFGTGFVVAGQEPGVPLADRLSEAMGLASNGSRLSAARRNKYLMIETLRAAGLRCADQFRSDDPAALARWARERGEFPVVVKPLSSGSTDGVTVCADPDAVLAAARDVLGTPDIFGLPNGEALAQSFLSGTEYIVDTVSYEGRRFVCGVWQYDKTLLPSGKPIYNRDILLDAAADPVPALVDYIDRVLAALDIRYGAVHAEVIMTPQGPALVEMGARLNGNMHPEFHDLCLGENQADLVALAYVHPEQFAARHAGRMYRKRQDAVVYNTETTADGIVEAVDEDTVSRIADLRSVVRVVPKLRKGSRIRPTVDLLTSPIRVFMTDPDPERIAADYAAVRELKDRVYQVSAAR